VHGQVERARIGGERQGAHACIGSDRWGRCMARLSVRASEVRGRVGAHARIGSNRWGRCMARLSVRASEVRGRVGAHARIGGDERRGRCTRMHRK